MKPVDINDNTYIEFSEESNKNNLKFQVGDNVRISQYKTICASEYTPYWSEEVFIIKKVKNTVP